MKLFLREWGDNSLPKKAVLLHGVTANSRSWVRVGPALAREGYHVFAPDLRGHDQSPKPDGQYSLDNILGDLPENVPCAPDLLVGHSLGGTISALGVSKDVLKPAYLVLEDPVLFFADKETPAGYLKNNEGNGPKDPEGILRANPRWTREDAEGRAAAFVGLNWDYMRQIFSDNAPWDLRPQTKGFAARVPTLLVLPEKSIYVPVKDAEEIQAALGPGSVVNVAGVGHGIHRDDLSAFLSLILSWIESQSK